jgi:hypothetical protein
MLWEDDVWEACLSTRILRTSLSSISHTQTIHPLNTAARTDRILTGARLAQSAERKALNLVVVGSSPTVGDV